MSIKDKAKEREEFLKEEKEEREKEIQYKVDAWITRIEILALIVVFIHEKLWIGHRMQSAKKNMR